MKRILILLALLIAFGAAISAQPVPIAGRQWKLTELNGTPVGTSNAYLEFERGQTRFSGNAGCNRMFGGVEIRGWRIVFSNVGTTRMACADRQVQRNETAFLAVLRTLNGFRLDGNTLVLLNGRRVVMRFVAPVKQKPGEPGESARFEDKKWMLDSIDGKPVPKVGRAAFVVFDNAKHSAGGNSSCNVFGGSYSTEGGSLRVTEVVSTMRACVEDVRMDIERKFLDGLQAANSYKIENGKLMLFRDDQLLLTMIEDVE